LDDLQRRQLIQEHLKAIEKLEATPIESSKGGWPPPSYYLLWHVLVGAMFGVLAAAVTLVVNIVGATIFGKHPLELIRVYLTFPMGEASLTEESGKVLTVGCLLYLVTGAAYGVLFHLILSTMFQGASSGKRFVAATVVGLAIWLVNFYGILSWLQPLLLGGNWIIRLMPFWVAALTHLAFAWVMLLMEGWGRFVPYRQAPITA
jgi:hypothetical protein